MHPQHQRWLSEDPAGMANGMNLYFAYMNVNHVDLMGDSVLDLAIYMLSPERQYWFTIGFTKGVWSQLGDVYSLASGAYNLVGDGLSYAFMDNWEQKCDKFNKARQAGFELVNNNPAIVKALIHEIVVAVTEYSDQYSHAVMQGKDRHKSWEMEGRVASEIATMFVGVGELALLAKGSKAAELAKAIQLLAKTKLDKAFHCGSESKFVKTVNHFLNIKCFVAGTQVLTDQGLVNIEDITIGQKVLSLDEKTGVKEYKSVVNTTVTHPIKLYDITYQDTKGEAYTVKTTGEHPFWVSDKGWVLARQLHLSDRLLISADATVAITNIISESITGDTFTTYNFEVEDDHNYFVLPERKTDLSQAILVHNTVCPDIGDNIASKFGGKKIGDKRYMFKNKRAAKMAASEIAGDLGSKNIIQRLSDYGEELLSKGAKKSNRKIGIHFNQIDKNGKPLRGYHDHHIGHSRYNDLRPHFNAWSERTGSTHKNNFHLYYGE